MTEKQTTEQPQSEFTPRKNGSQQPPLGQPPQTIKCFVVPLDAMEQIRDALREAPYRYAKPVMDGLATLQVMDVPVKPADQ